MKHFKAIILFAILTIPNVSPASDPEYYDVGKMLFSPFSGLHIFQDGQRFGGSDPNYELFNTYSLGLRLGYVLHKNFDIEGSLNFAPADINLGSVNIFFYHADLLYNFLHIGRVVPYLDFGLGAETFSASPTGLSTFFAITYAAGIKVFIIKDLAARLEARAYTKFSSTYTNLNMNLGIGYYFGLKGQKGSRDRDGDGYLDDHDLCPLEPEIFNGYIDEDGCPDILKADVIKDTSCEDK